mmetsp:Transcript_23606/g.48117  ORF Transcript_23606/g.48117 Transcript_23606/m.48117 type:complete len:206 (+) Transcript_23606:228-845(+)
MFFLHIYCRNDLPNSSAPRKAAMRCKQVRHTVQGETKITCVVRGFTHACRLVCLGSKRIESIPSVCLGRFDEYSRRRQQKVAVGRRYACNASKETMIDDHSVDPPIIGKSLPGPSTTHTTEGPTCTSIVLLRSPPLTRDRCRCCWTPRQTTTTTTIPLEGWLGRNRACSRRRRCWRLPSGPENPIGGRRRPAGFVLLSPARQSYH